MIDRCANPDCRTDFRYFNEGKVFSVDMRPLRPAKERCELCGRAHHVRHYWLCDGCARTMSIRCLQDGSVQLIRNNSVPGVPVPLRCTERKVA